MFITFEGPDGSGKSTQITLLSFYLRQKGYKVLTTREPGGTHIGDQVRECLHAVDNKGMAAVAEVLLYSASRAQLVHEIIRPAISAGHIVLSDRYADSTLAYQGYGRGLDLGDLDRITRFATGGLKPDLTILLDLDVQYGLSRRAAGGLEMNRMDLQTLDFYRRVREGYRELARAEPKRWVVVDAERPVDAVQADVRRAIEERLVDR
ncbi:MAG: dTMP kinase [Chloroflexi bacterium]|nr:dTMP kinase [Chloroflexota bacterium]MCI0648121.1 dTMP kinase [Chloroflexota bacterium]MCI0725457.1 dTMP kinase [Chloroflexota bacterium]